MPFPPLEDFGKPEFKGMAVHAIEIYFTSVPAEASREGRLYNDKLFINSKKAGSRLPAFLNPFLASSAIKHHIYLISLITL